MSAARTSIKKRASRNRTLDLTEREKVYLRRRLIFSENETNLPNCRDKIICGDAFQVLTKLPEKSFDLLFADPPYNLTKNFGENVFRQTSLD
jgi:site-specific DNA-methyltransferase (adenine-specific)